MEVKDIKTFLLGFMQPNPYLPGTGEGVPALEGAGQGGLGGMQIVRNLREETPRKRILCLKAGS